jgi:8-oxo-dGTP pyrophosphatase MutT (NUDIX family)
MKKEVLYSTKWLELWKLSEPENGVDGYVCSHAKWANGQAVAVLPFRRKLENSEKEFFLRQEITPCWGMEPNLSSITGGMDKVGEEPVACASRELHEEGGYVVPPESSRWVNLGKARLSKASTMVVHLFAVDLAGLEMVEAPGDGSELEDKAYCEWRTDPENAVDALVGRMVFGLERLIR